jgi:hypothetical protein
VALVDTRLRFLVSWSLISSLWSLSLSLSLRVCMYVCMCVCWLAQFTTALVTVAPPPVPVSFVQGGKM